MHEVLKDEFDQLFAFIFQTAENLLLKHQFERNHSVLVFVKYHQGILGKEELSSFQISIVNAPMEGVVLSILNCVPNIGPQLLFWSKQVLGYLESRLQNRHVITGTLLQLSLVLGFERVEIEVQISSQTEQSQWRFPSTVLWVQGNLVLAVKGDE